MLLALGVIALSVLLGRGPVALRSRVVRLGSLGMTLLRHDFLLVRLIMLAQPVATPNPARWPFTRFDIAQL
jgi:hypothetical protein